MNEALQSDVCVGIFWSISGKIYGESEMRNDQSDALEGIVDSHLEHWKVWESPEKLVGIPIVRKDYEYFAFPRGRVLYDVRSKKHIVYCDASLMNSNAKQQICTLFGFNFQTVLWKRDAHYTTDEDGIRDLFDGGT